MFTWFWEVDQIGGFDRGSSIDRSNTTDEGGVAELTIRFNHGKAFTGNRMSSVVFQRVRELSHVSNESFFGTGGRLAASARFTLSFLLDRFLPRTPHYRRAS